MTIKRGDIVLVNLAPSIGSEQGKIRPCIIVQSDSLNQVSPNTIIVPLTSKIPEKEYPQLAIVDSKEQGLKEQSAALCNQIRAISIEGRILKKIGNLSQEAMQKVDEAIKVSLGLD